MALTLLDNFLIMKSLCHWILLDIWLFFENISHCFLDLVLDSLRKYTNTHILVLREICTTSLYLVAVPFRIQVVKYWNDEIHHSHEEYGKSVTHYSVYSTSREHKISSFAIHILCTHSTSLCCVDIESLVNTWFL